MHFLIVFLGIVATIAFFIIRAHYAYGVAREINRDTKGLQHRAKRSFQNLVGTRLSRVRDPQLAAAILLIQIVRTGSPVTAQEKTAILDCFHDPMRVENPSAMFAKAWEYTENRAFFSMVADELLPLLRDRLGNTEKQQLVEMLHKVASAYNDVGELQQSSIARLKKRLFL
ncbi:TerB family tellurite resistance protein [Nitratireductor sp. ZSWI3]|uniref:TerB family tellurite resistance protein n=1 Tax=Nitratireductor sp. ZSWI3 TaxID=2966359 RepID=UPI0021506A94|nr:TerB family tellurite resistance protein [Nitratireductor sp. ZSWI3]MCR4265980.1 TerB family tellurite resistance protein [Nitratireductor sp. ZSWI3]